MTNSLSARRPAAVAALAIAIPAHAAVFLTANFTGSFDGASTLDGVPLGSETAFSLSATFDASALKGSLGTAFLYQVTGYTLTLNGHGTFVGIPSGDNNVLLYSDNATPAYTAGIFSPSSQGFAGFYSAASHPFDATSPTPVEFSSGSGSAFFGPYNFTLVGVPGGFSPNDLGTAPLTTTITANAVPEPMETAGVIGLGLVAFAGWRRRKV